MKKIFILLLIAIFTCSAQARPHHSWHHRDWLGLTIGAAIVTAIATTPPTPTVQETVIVAQPAPIIVQQLPAAPAPIITTTPIIVQQPAPIIVQQPTYVAPVVRPMPLPPPPPPHWRRPLPPPPRRHHRSIHRR